jgi:hypothetical protein
MSARGSAGAAAVAMAGLALLALSGCQGGGRPSPASTATRPAPAPSAVTGSEDYQNFQLYDDVCHGVAHPHAPAYTGSGPHPVAYFFDDPHGGGYGYESSAPNHPWDTLDLRKVQLVVCVTSTDGPAIRTCGQYGVTKVSLARGIFFIRLYESRTARLVADPIRLDGAPSDQCPQYIAFNKGRPLTLTLDSRLSPDQVSQALQPYAG